MLACITVAAWSTWRKVTSGFSGDIYEIFLVDTIDTKIDEELVTHIQIPVKRQTL